MKNTRRLVFLIGGACAANYQIKKGNNGENFKKSMKLIYPNFEKEGQVVSKT